MLILRPPWDSQPPEAVGVDWSNPLASGLAHVWQTLSFPLLDSAAGANGAIGVGTGGTTGTYLDAGRYGRHIRFNDAGTGTSASKRINVGNSAGSGGPSGNVFTFFCLINPGSIASYQTIFSSTSSAGIQIRLDTSGRIYFDKQGVINIGLSSSGIAASVWSSIAVSYNGTTAAYYINGRSAGTSSSTQTFTKSQYAIGSASSETISNGSLLAVPCLWDRVLTDSEIAEIAANPWQLFEPRRIYIPISITSGGAYTLNLETGIYSFTGNSATLSKDSKLTLDSGTYALSGSNASLLKGLILEASSGSYSLSGSGASLFYTHLLNASSGSYSVTGSNATLTYTPTAGAYTLNLESGAYVLLGQDVTFVYSGSEVTLKAGSWIRYRIIT